MKKILFLSTLFLLSLQICFSYVGEDEFIYVAGGAESGATKGTIKKIYKDTGELIASVELPEGNFATGGIAVGSYYIWVCSPSKDNIHRIEKRGFVLRDTFSVNPSGIDEDNTPWGIAVGSDRVWVTLKDSDQVRSFSRVDGTLLSTADLPINSAPWGITVDENSVWVANSGLISSPGAESITKINRSTGVITKTISIDPVSAGNGGLSPRAAPIGIFSDNTNVWVAVNEVVTGGPSTTGGTLIKYNIATDANSINGSLTDRMVLGQIPQYITGNFSDQIIVSYLSESFISKINPTTLTFLGHPDLPNGPYGRGLSYSDSKLWIAGVGNDLVVSNTEGIMNIESSLDTGTATLFNDVGTLNLSFGDATGKMFDQFFSTDDLLDSGVTLQVKSPYSLAASTVKLGGSNDTSSLTDQNPSTGLKPLNKKGALKKKAKLKIKFDDKTQVGVIRLYIKPTSDPVKIKAKAQIKKNGIWKTLDKYTDTYTNESLIPLYGFDKTKRTYRVLLINKKVNGTRNSYSILEMQAFAPDEVSVTL